MEPVSTALHHSAGHKGRLPTVAGLLVLSVITASLGILIGLFTLSLTPILVSVAFAMGLPAALVTYGLIRHLYVTEAGLLQKPSADLGTDATA